jgi:PHD/YefM family antitoxin component YafN of YafNO toxin-antitoxin module
MAEQHLTAKIKDIKSNGKPLVVLLKGAPSTRQYMLHRTHWLDFMFAMH